MRTTKPISTISYNSKEFLQGFLNKLVDAEKVAFWSAVRHIGEQLDDGTKEKDHWHVFIEPNTRVDTMELQKLSCENDPSHPDKPFKCINFRSSKWDDWLWYGLHDTDYLLTKAEIRQYAYTTDDFLFSDSDEFEVRYQSAIHSSAIASGMKIRKMMKQNSVAQLCAIGVIQPNQAFHYMAYEQAIEQGLHENERLMELESDEFKEKRKKKVLDEQQRMLQLNSPIGSVDDEGFLTVPEGLTEDDIF